MSDTFFDAAISEKDKMLLAQNAAVISNYFKSNDYRFSEISPREDRTEFQLSFAVANKKLELKVVVCANPDVCEISAELPVCADRIYEYPLCRTIAKDNFRFCFPSFKYNEVTGIVSCEYSFSTAHGIYEDDFDVYFNTVVITAFKYYNDMRSNCAGKFSDEETLDIFDSIRQLAKGIAECGE